MKGINAHFRHSKYPKPVIGLTGGIGSGKSFVANALQHSGCAIINSDAVAHEALQSPEIKAQLRAWLGDKIFTETGDVDRQLLAAQVFTNADATAKLNGLIHPKVAEIRDRQMPQLMANPAVKAVVWDTPLLLEAGLDQQCDAVIFVDTPYKKRLERVSQTRGWTAEELNRRENLQFPLDKKANLADYSVDNSGEVTASLRQVREILSLILSRKAAPVLR